MTLQGAICLTYHAKIGTTMNRHLRQHKLPNPYAPRHGRQFALPFHPADQLANTSEILICVWYRYQTQNAAATGFDHYISIKFGTVARKKTYGEFFDFASILHSPFSVDTKHLYDFLQCVQSLAAAWDQCTCGCNPKILVQRAIEQQQAACWPEWLKLVLLAVHLVKKELCSACTPSASALLFGLLTETSLVENY